MPRKSPPPISPEAQTIITHAIRAGAFLETACEAAGISKSCFLYWQKRWKANPLSAPDPFFQSLIQATAQSEIDALEAINTESSRWQARAWFLERRFPKHWGKPRSKPKTKRTRAKSKVNVEIELVESPAPSVEVEAPATSLEPAQNYQ